MLSKLKLPIPFIESTPWSTIISGEPATLTLLLFFAILLALESHFPREKLSTKQLRQSYQTNIGLFVFNITVFSFLSVSSLLMLAEPYSDKGLLNSIRNPLGKAILSFLLLDLLLYLWHKASHSFDCLWMFHKVHHNDPYLNVTTAFRVHLLELLATTALKAVYIILLGVDQVMLLTNEAIITFFVMFHHTNISIKSEKLLGRIIIVPSLHRVHHSTQRNEHDCNYGAVLSLWDRLFGTLAELKPAAIGIKGHSPQDLIALIKFGFTMETLPAIQPISLETMIAEAAYYKAERRNFSPGYEIHDWLEAKREIIKLTSPDKPGNWSRNKAFDFLKLRCAINQTKSG